MNDLKLYNVIFPIWFILFFPPIILLTLVGNFIIDSIVLIACIYIYKLSTEGRTAKDFYKKTIFKVWLFGFIADLIGASILFLLGMMGDSFGLSNELMYGINYDPFSQPLAVLIILVAIFVSAIFIYIFNSKYVLKNVIEDSAIRMRVALTIAVVTMPWTFLIPTKWFY